MIAGLKCIGKTRGRGKMIKRSHLIVVVKGSVGTGWVRIRGSARVRLSKVMGYGLIRARWSVVLVGLDLDRVSRAGLKGVRWSA